MVATREVYLSQYPPPAAKTHKETFVVSKFLVVTDAHGAVLDDLIATHRSLVLAGSNDITWFVHGAVPDSLKKLRRRWSFGRATVVDNLAGSSEESEIAEHQYIVFLSAGDGLQRESLMTFQEFIEENSDADLFYGDSAHPTGVKAEPFSFVRRPGWSPERLRAHCYVGETLIVTSQVVAKSLGKTESLSGLLLRHPHDRALRLCENAKNISRMPQVLTVGKTSDTRPLASLSAVTEHCERQSILADCELEASVPSVHVRRKITANPSVAVIVPTRGTLAEVFGQGRVLVVEAVRSLFEKSTFQNFEVVIVADTPTPNSVLEELKQIGGDRLKVINYDRPFNFAEKNNLGAMSCDSDLILLLNDDTEIITDDALEIMVSMFNDPQVGIVGPMLLFEDSTIQSAGHIFSPDPTDLYRGRSPETCGPQNLLKVQREVSSLIAACALIRRDVFEKVGGLCMGFPGNWNDIDFCLKVQLAGYRAVFTPHAHLFHFESKTRIAKRVDSEVAKLGARWGSVLNDDPYFNPNLQRYTNIWKTDSTSKQTLDEALV